MAFVQDSTQATPDTSRQTNARKTDPIHSKAVSRITAQRPSADTIRRRPSRRVRQIAGAPVDPPGPAVYPMHSSFNQDERIHLGSRYHIDLAAPAFRPDPDASARLAGTRGTDCRGTVSVLRLAQPRVSTHLAKLKEAGLVHDRRAGVSAYYRFNAEPGAKPAAMLRALRENIDDALLRDDAQRLPAALAQRASTEGWADSGCRRHGTPLLARPHLGSPGARHDQHGRDRRCARYRVRRRRPRRTAGTARQFHTLPGRERAGDCRRACPAQTVPQCRSATGRHACAGSGRAQVRSGAADARPPL